jgi:hypothetical protein
MIPKAQAIADALQDTRGQHDAAIMAQHGISREELAEAAYIGGGILWCGGCNYWVSQGETRCRLKRKGCVNK